MENSLSVAMLKEIPEYLQKTIWIEKKRAFSRGSWKCRKSRWFSTFAFPNRFCWSRALTSIFGKISDVFIFLLNLFIHNPRISKHAHQNRVSIALITWNFYFSRLNLIKPPCVHGFNHHVSHDFSFFATSKPIFTSQWIGATENLSQKPAIFPSSTFFSVKTIHWHHQCPMKPPFSHGFPRPASRWRSASWRSAWRPSCSAWRRGCGPRWRDGWRSRSRSAPRAQKFN